MAPSIQRYFQEGLAPSTHRTYSAALKRFHKFCVQYSVMNPFPVTEHLLCCFAAFLADQCLAPQTGQSYSTVFKLVCGPHPLCPPQLTHLMHSPRSSPLPFPCIICTKPKNRWSRPGDEARTGPENQWSRPGNEARTGPEEGGHII